ncbi:lanthionine synthetase LanC family protein [Nocardioides cynanchi]|uniref:lanthionine synthetase LanC family protein n=1 Tax=Nocardioides cynanchi TaxID=2558918 RepID=UPI001244D48F|nr:lanthionine synthetase LanC family protein [Nocardioides cynanchi]
MPDVDTYRSLAERSWSWAMAQVRRDDAGLWIPEHTDQTGPGDYPYGMHSGVGGLAHVLSEIRLTRPWTDAESELASGITETLVGLVPEATEYDYFDGLTSTIGVLTALEAPGPDQAVARLLELATPDGWQPSFLEPPVAVPEGRCNDVTLGTASVLVGALWALRYDVPGADTLASRAVEILVAEGIEQETGVYWPHVPLRFLLREDVQMPNWSHGQAGIAGAVAAAGIALDRPDLVALAVRGAEQLVATGDTSDGGFRLGHRIPSRDDLDTYTYTWCHGPAGTSLLFSALDRAGVPAVSDRTPYDWERACLHSLLVSGIPERLHPGFWDNDGRCCGTAGVGDVVLSMWQRHGHDDELAFAVTLADALVERSINEGDHTYWRFLEHRIPDPLLPPRIGWMQGAAGIAAYLFRISRVLEQGRTAPAVPRMDTWWTLPAGD